MSRVRPHRKSRLQLPDTYQTPIPIHEGRTDLFATLRLDNNDKAISHSSPCGREIARRQGTDRALTEHGIDIIIRPDDSSIYGDIAWTGHLVTSVSSRYQGHLNLVGGWHLKAETS